MVWLFSCCSICFSLHFPSSITKATHHLLKTTLSCNSTLCRWQSLHKRCCDMCGGDRWCKIHIWIQPCSADVTLHFSHWCHCDLSPCSNKTQAKCWEGEVETGDGDSYENVCVRKRLRAISSVTALEKPWIMDSMSSFCSLQCAQSTSVIQRYSISINRSNDSNEGTREVSTLC